MKKVLRKDEVDRMRKSCSKTERSNPQVKNRVRIVSSAKSVTFATVNRYPYEI